MLKKEPPSANPVSLCLCVRQLSSIHSSLTFLRLIDHVATIY